MPSFLPCFAAGLLVGMIIAFFLFCLFSINHVLDCEECHDDDDLDTESDALPVRK